MTRTAIALVLGVLLGIGATLWFAPSSMAPRPLDGWLPASPIVTPATIPVAPPEAREASRDFYRRLADADPAALASMIEQAAARAPSTDRDLALAVLFKRYAELDPVRAVRLVRRTRVGGAALGAVYGAWARAAPEQVLAALSTVTSPDDAAEIAVALIMARGDDAAAVRRVAGVLAAREDEATFGGVPPIGPVFGPVGPIGLAGPAVSRSALALAAQRWADLDPRRALAVARGLDDERVRLAFETAALRALTRVAPAEAFAHLQSLDTSALQGAVLGGSLGELARADPERLLSAVRDLPPDARRAAEMAAVQHLAQRDPLAAARHLERMSLGPERQVMLQTVARAYGRRDAAAALAWAREQRGEPMLVGAVLAGVAEQDADHALDLALGLTVPMERTRAVQMVASTSARDDATAEALANRLLAVDDPQIRDLVAFTVVSMWASRSPERAMEWLLANGRNVAPNAFQQLGQQLAMRDPQSAAAYTAQVPDAARETWVNGVAQGYAQNDPRGAIDWLTRFRGEPWYGRAAGTVAMTVAQRDGAAAARLFDDLDAGADGVPRQQLVNIIATNWANQEPAAAAEWSLDRATEQEREMAVRGVVGVWVSQDLNAARQWTVRLPPGTARDAALTSVLMASAMQPGNNIDATVLSAFASAQARQTAVLQIVQGFARSDPAKARALADAHLEPAFRANAERMIEAAGNPSGRPPMGVVGIQGVAPGQVVSPVLRARQ